MVMVGGTSRHYEDAVSAQKRIEEGTPKVPAGAANY